MDEIKMGPNQINILHHCMGCVYCGKIYKTRKSLDNHVTVCEIIYKTKRKTIIVEEDELPSQKIMYKMILELTSKCIRLEEKVDELNKWVIRKKKKINILDWLNSNKVPYCDFKKFTDNIELIESDIDFLFNNSFNETINEIFSRILHIMNENNNIAPLFCVSQKTNIIYIYSKNINDNSKELSWKELHKDDFVWFLNQMFTKIFNAFLKWGQKYKNIEDNSSCILYDGTMSKIMKVDFKLECVQNKIRAMLVSMLKTDLKTLIEYELEF